MPSTPPFVQFDSSGMRPESMFTFMAVTLGFLLAIWLVNRRTRPVGTTLILLGVFVEILAVGYGMIGVPSVIMVIPALTKIGFLLVVGGVAFEFACRLPCSARTERGGSCLTRNAALRFWHYRS